MSQDGVATAFDILLEEIENTIEELNQAGAQAFQKRDYDSARALTTKGEQMTTFRAQITELQEQWDDRFSTVAIRAREHPTQNRSQPRKITDRLQHGLRTPETAYYAPILQTLVQMGGAGIGTEVVKRVGEAMNPIFNKYDYANLPSNNEPRWSKTAHWARWNMVKKGWLAPDSPRGTWEITEAGRRWLAAVKK